MLSSRIDLKPVDFSFDGTVKVCANDMSIVALLHAPEFPLLRFVKMFDQLLITADVINCDMDRNPYFRRLDKEGIVSHIDPQLRTPPLPSPSHNFVVYYCN